MSLLGVQQAANVFAPRKFGDSLYAARQAATSELSDVAWAAFQVGDQVQRELVDFAWGVLTLEALTPDSLRRIARDVLWQSSETASVLAPIQPIQLAWRQLRNNYEVYNLVKNARSMLRIPAGGDLDLRVLIDNAYALGEYPDLWAIEGLGHDYADHRWDGKAFLSGLLTDDRASAAPPKALTMLHAGIGLCFAQRLLPGLTPHATRQRLTDVLGMFLSLCADNSRAGYTGAAYESLGLVTRTWHPEMVPAIDSWLAENAPDILGYFWHGAGRALYFLPIYFVPGGLSPWHTVDREAPHEIGRFNMRAGLAWATTLVNMRHPAILEELLHRHGSLLAENDAFANGVASSLVMAWDITPGDRFIEGFLEYRPNDHHHRFRELWDGLAGRPARQALAEYHPILQRTGHLEEVFHYQPLDALTAQMGGIGE